MSTIFFQGQCSPGILGQPVKRGLTEGMHPVWQDAVKPIPTLVRIEGSPAWGRIIYPGEIEL